jgi:hypothetical protein
MRLRSRGLGRKELVMDFREYAVLRQDEEVVVVGAIRDPVNWDFTIRFCEDDIVGMTRLVLRPAMLGLLLRALFKRRRHHHWSQEHAEHLAEGARRLATAGENAAERAAACVAPSAERKAVRSIRAPAPATADRRIEPATEPLAADGS